MGIKEAREEIENAMKDSVNIEPVMVESDIWYNNGLIKAYHEVLEILRRHEQDDDTKMREIMFLPETREMAFKMLYLTMELYNRKQNTCATCKHYGQAECMMISWVTDAVAGEIYETIEQTPKDYCSRWTQKPEEATDHSHGGV